MSEATRAITVYIAATGEVRYSADVAPGTEDQWCEAGEAWIEGWIDTETHYVDPETGEPAPLRAWALEIGPNRIGNVPAGTRAFWQLSEIMVDDGELAFEPEHGLPDTLRVRLIHPLYPMALVEVEIG